MKVLICLALTAISVQHLSSPCHSFKMINDELKGVLTYPVITQIQKAKFAYLLDNPSAEGKHANFEQLRTYLTEDNDMNETFGAFAAKIRAKTGLQIVDLGSYSYAMTEGKPSVK